MTPDLVPTLEKQPNTVVHAKQLGLKLKEALAKNSFVILFLVR